MRRIVRRHGLPRWAWRAAKRTDDPALTLAVIDLHRPDRKDVAAAVKLAPRDAWLRARHVTWAMRLMR